MKTLPRKNGDLAETMFLRPQRPDDHRDFEMVLPWFTPLFVYAANGQDWVRWSVPRPVAERLGMPRGCSCCGELEVAEDDCGDVHVDTALSETSWWLKANGYGYVAKRNTPTPQEGEGK